jgi:Calcineurin-like phosphoesterase
VGSSALRRLAVAATLLALALAAGGCTIRTLMAVGDTCADTSSPECAQVAQTIRDQHPDAFLHLGDMQYPEGSQSAFDAGYGRIFADLHAITYPVFGETHDFGWSGYPVTFMNEHSAVAGKLAPNQWGYSFDLGAWHVVALDYEHPDPAALEADLVAHPSHCLMAIDHAPYLGTPTTVHPRNELTRAFVEPLFRHGVDLLVSGHNHVYERMAPQDIDGHADPDGPVVFQVGTGGIGHYSFTSPPAPNSVVRSTSAFGALFLSLTDAGWGSRYVDAPGSSLTDTASGGCGP